MKRRFRVYNKIEDEMIFEVISERANEFVEFVQKIAKENDDSRLDLGSISESINYIERFCSNLTLEIEEAKFIDSNHYFFESDNRKQKEHQSKL